MDIAATKLELMELLLQVNEESTLYKVKNLLKKESGDWWDDLSEEGQRRIKQGASQLDAGEGISHDEVMSKFKKWH